MKEPKNGIDKKKFIKFYERVTREARKLFPGEDGESLININMVDRSRFDCNHPPLNVPYTHLIETDREWRDVLGSLSCNVNSATDRLERFVRTYNHEKSREEDIGKLITNVQSLDKKLNTNVLCVTTLKFPSVPSGYNWFSVGEPIHFIWNGGSLEETTRNVCDTIYSIASNAILRFGSLDVICVYLNVGSGYGKVYILMPKDWKNDTKAK